MAGWEVFTVVKDNLINDVFGSTTAFALFLVISVMILLMAARLSPLLAFLIAVPLFISTIASGYFGGAGYVKAIVILILSVIWGAVLWNLIEK